MAIDNFAAANLAMMTAWAADRANLSEKQQEIFDSVVTSPVAPEAAAHFAEFVFANHGDFSKASRDAAADVADFAAGNRFYGLGDDARGTKIAAALRGKPAKTDPDAIARFKFKDGEPAQPDAGPGIPPPVPANPAA